MSDVRWDMALMEKAVIELFMKQIAMKRATRRSAHE